MLDKTPPTFGSTKFERMLKQMLKPFKRAFTCITTIFRRASFDRPGNEAKVLNVNTTYLFTVELDFGQ